ncbi:MAG: DUF5696 domain-containing protein, partial [Halanaerobiales bacterium]
GDLSGLLEEYNYDFYPQVFFQKVFKTSLFDGFSPRIDTARMLNRQIAREYDYDQVYFDRIEEEFAYLAAPAGLEERVKGFYEQLSDHNLRAANLADLGQYVYGDYRDNENRYVDRQGALREIIEQLDYLKNDQELNLLLENGNAYTFPFTEKIADIPHKSSGYRIFDRDIPFMQIVLQGYFDYTGPPINLTGDYRESLLKNVETGAGLQFRLMAREASVLRKTQFDHLYDVSYQDWEEDVFGWYEEINSKLKPVIGETIIEHKELADNVFLTLFENDTAVVVNYNQQEVEVKGEDIAAQDFIVIDDFDDQGGF